MRLTEGECEDSTGADYNDFILGIYKYKSFTKKEVAKLERFTKTKLKDSFIIYFY